METYWEEIHCETVNNFEIVTSVTEETDDPRGHFDDDGETASLIRDGIYSWFMVRVEARIEDITLAEDYLGGCCYSTPKHFVMEPNGYYDDMKKNVLAEAREKIQRLAA